MTTRQEPRGMLATPRPGQPFNCWIDPTGDVHVVGLWGHSEFATEVIRERYGFGRDFCDGHKAVEMLHERGWARIHTRSNQSYAQIVTPNQFRVTRPLLNGIRTAYEMCKYPEIADWLHEHGG